MSSGIPQALVTHDSDASLLYNDSGITLGTLIIQDTLDVTGDATILGNSTVEGNSGTIGGVTGGSFILGDYTISLITGILSISKGSNLLFTLDESSCPV